MASRKPKEPDGSKEAVDWFQRLIIAIVVLVWAASNAAAILVDYEVPVYVHGMTGVAIGVLLGVRKALRND